MNKYFKGFILSVLAAIAAFAAVIALNYFDNSIQIDRKGRKTTKQASEVVTVFNWNLGYAGLGKESDFIMDGGESLYPPSRAIVEKNRAGIKTVIAQNTADIYQFQEISKPDLLTLGVDVLAGIDETLPGLDRIFSTDFATRLIPRKWALKHGLASYTSLHTKPPTIHRLPNQNDRLGGIVKRQYQMIERQFTDAQGADWAILNVHLAAFDEGGVARASQMRALLDYVQTLYNDDKHVVVGGDWNLQLTPTEFAYTTDKKLLTWLVVFPLDILPKDWQLAFDPATPTVRSNERSYTAGENYTTIIDGFLVSPNVDVRSIHTLNLEFEYSDHQPQLAKFAQKNIH